jgi:hypothetical protein
VGRSIVRPAIPVEQIDAPIDDYRYCETPAFPTTHLAKSPLHPVTDRSCWDGEGWPMGPHDDDPYCCVSLVFTVFMCDRCSNELIGDDVTGESYGPGDEWYHRFGEYARRGGWYAETITVANGSQEWRVLCPACAAHHVRSPHPRSPCRN